MLLKRLGYFLLEIIEVVVFAISIFLFLYLLILQPHKIKGASMEPNFHDNEYLITDKISYRFNSPKRGDVIVFKAPPNYKEEFIKRIIGLPGEKVNFKEGSIYINDNLINETYLPNGTRTLSGNVLKEATEFIIPTNSYLVLGDNRNHSLDSRNLGFIAQKYITGRALFIYWPPQKMGLIKYNLIRY